MTVLVGFLLLAALVGGFHAVSEPPKGTVHLAGGVVGAEAGVARVAPRPLSEFKDAGVVKQSYDYSCGSAALATLLNGYLGETFTERQVIDGLLRYGDVKAIVRRQAFSLLDMKRFVTALGYKAAGFKGEMGDLVELEYPCIVPIEFSGYKHFVVLKAVRAGHAFLADPFQGNLSLSAAQFEAMWTEKVLFLVSPKGGKLSAPRLAEADLRFVDSETARNTLFLLRTPASAGAAEDAVRQTAGALQLYRPK